MKGGDQLLLREYWPEVVRIGGRVVVLRALGVDVGVVSQCIRFCAKFTRAEVNCQIEC